MTDALNRLQELIRSGMVVMKKWRPARKSYGSIKRHLESNNKPSQTKSLRKKVIVLL